MFFPNSNKMGYHLTRFQLFCVLVFGFHLLLFRTANGIAEENKTTSVHVGVVLDLNSSIGSMADICISMAISDFYTTHSTYKTRLSLHTNNSHDVVDAAFAALDLINNVQVNAIIGPQTSTQAKFVASLGEKAKVPIISFSATSPSLSTTDNKFFLRTAQDDSSQVEPIVSLVQAFGWHQTVIIFQDTEYGTGLVPYLVDALQQNDIRVTSRCAISPKSSDLEILKKLVQLMKRETRVMLVHMAASLGSRLFLLAKEAGMMSDEYVWIASDGITSMLDAMDERVVYSMEGVLGIRPYIPPSRSLETFKTRWRNATTKLNLVGLWAYDTVWALAMAAEGIGEEEYKSNQSESNATDSRGLLRVSEVGLRLRDKLLGTKFKGLSGDFRLINGQQLKSSAFEIVNLVRKQAKVIGYWTPEKGFFHTSNNAAADKLIPPVWPGGTKSIPRGWVIPATGEKMRIGVPIREGFTEYLKMDVDAYTKEPIFSGFSYDVFLAVLDTLPFAIPHQLFPFRIDSQNSFKTYDDLLYQIKLERFDGVVGDIVITSNRSQYVDFTLPYYESNVAMVVKIKQDQRKNIWIFLKPLSWDLWLTTALGFIFTGIVVWVLEHRVNHEFRGPLDQQVGTICWFSFSTLVFAHREKVINNLSKFVLIIWIFVVLILTQSYTASLASMLTVQRLQPTVVDADQLRRNGDFVGHRTGSYIKEFLINQLHFDPSKLRHYSTSEEFDQALSKGSQNGGVTAIFEVEHILQLFLPQYCDKYMTAGPTYKTDGLGFAFPLNSPLVAYMSRAILSVTEDKGKMDILKRKYNLNMSPCEDQTTISSDSLTVQSFGGLFIITGVASLCSLLAFVFGFLQSHWSDLPTLGGRSIWSALSELAARFDTRHPSIASYNTTRESRIHPVASAQETE